MGQTHEILWCWNRCWLVTVNRWGVRILSLDLLVIILTYGVNPVGVEVMIQNVSTSRLKKNNMTRRPSVDVGINWAWHRFKHHHWAWKHGTAPRKRHVQWGKFMKMRFWTILKHLELFFVSGIPRIPKVPRRLQVLPERTRKYVDFARALRFVLSPDYCKWKVFGEDSSIIPGIQNHTGNSNSRNIGILIGAINHVYITD